MFFLCSWFQSQNSDIHDQNFLSLIRKKKNKSMKSLQFLNFDNF